MAWYPVITYSIDLLYIVLEHGAPHHKARAIDNLIKGLSQYASHEQSIKSILKALKEGGPEVLDKVVTRLCEPPKGYFSFCRWDLP